MRTKLLVLVSALVALTALSSHQAGANPPPLAPLPVLAQQPEIPALVPMSIVIAAAPVGASATITRLDLIPGYILAADVDNYAEVELSEEDGIDRQKAVSLGIYDTAVTDWDTGVIALTWTAPVGYTLRPGHSIVGRWNHYGPAGRTIPPSAWRVTQ